MAFPRKALVTGGAGFIGSHVVDHLLAGGADVVVYDNLTTGSRGNLADHELQPKLRLVQADVLDLPRLCGAMEGVDTVFHFQANAHVRGGPQRTRINHEQTTIATWNVLEAMRTTGAGTIVFASSAVVYGEPDVFPTPESIPLVQTSLYGASKLAGEGELRRLSAELGIEYVILRPTAVYGPRDERLLKLFRSPLRVVTRTTGPGSINVKALLSGSGRMEARGRRAGLRRAGRGSVRRVVDAVIDWHLAEQEWIDALQAAHVVAVLVGERASPVVRVDAADTAEVVPCDLRVELVEAKVLLAQHDADAAEWHRSDDRPLAAANRAVAAAWIDDAVRQVEFDHYGAAVTGEAVLREDRDASHGCDRHSASAHQVRVMPTDSIDEPHGTGMPHLALRFRQCAMPRGLD